MRALVVWSQIGTSAPVRERYLLKEGSECEETDSGSLRFTTHAGDVYTFAVGVWLRAHTEAAGG